MTSKCENCDKGVASGNMVSHAKNRVKRLFKPNLQKYNVFFKGSKMKVTLCTKCIKRLKKDGKVGAFRQIVYLPKKAQDLEVKKEVKKELEKLEKTKIEKEEKKDKKEKEEKVTTPAMKIEDIVGKK